MVKRYSSRNEKLDEAFLNKKLVKAKNYDRIAGYFCSSILEVAGESIEAVSGTVRVVCNSGLSKEDVTVACHAQKMKQEWCAYEPEEKYTSDKSVERLVRLHRLLVSGKLEVRVIPDEVYGLMHGKAGVITYDDGSKTSFIGSINETKSAFSLNYEMVWEDDSPDAVAWVQSEFDFFWNNPYAVNLCDFVVEDIDRISKRRIVPLHDWREHATDKLQKQLEDALSKAWEKGVSLSEIQKKIENDQERQEMEEYVSVSEQLAGILVTSNKIKGNPRLIKRFLNALEIRKKVANLNGITVDLGILVKMLLFERCASQGAFDYLAEIVSKTTDGKPDKIKEIESDLEREKEYHAPDPKWNDEFIKEWVLLSPRLSDYDLRPLLYLSRDKSITLAGYDKISPAGEEIFKALQANKGILIKRDLVEKISQLGQEESEAILQRLLRMGRSEQWTNDSLGRAFHMIEAYPDLGSQLAVELTSLPCVARKPALVTAIKEKAWAKELIEQWEEDSNTPAEAKKILSRR